MKTQATSSTSKLRVLPLEKSRVLPLEKSSLSVNGSRLWNKLPLEIRNKKTFSAFKNNLKLYMANNQTLTQL